MLNLIKEFNGKEIRQREDGYYSATDMCKAFKGKLFAHWMENDWTKEYLEEKSLIIGYPIIKKSKENGKALVETSAGRYGETWVHPKVALRLAQWLCPKFAAQVDEWVFEYLTEGFLLQESMSEKQISKAASEIKIQQDEIRATRIDTFKIWKNESIQRSLDMGLSLQDAKSIFWDGITAINEKVFGVKNFNSDRDNMTEEQQLRIIEIENELIEDLRNSPGFFPCVIYHGWIVGYDFDLSMANESIKKEPSKPIQYH